MGYFIQGFSYGRSFGPAESERVRQNAPTLQSNATAVFASNGSFYWKIDKPLAGEIFGTLSDVSLLNVGQTPSSIDNVSSFTTRLYQLKQEVDPSGKKYFAFEPLSEGVKHEDTVLGQSYPLYKNNSTFEKLTVDPGGSGSAYIPEFYLEVSGSPVPEVYSLLGVRPPDVGRFLVTRGEIAGQRSQEWGGWVDTVTVGGATPQQPLPPVPNNPDPDQPSDAQTAQQLLDAAYAKGAEFDAEAEKNLANLARMKSDLADAKLLLEGAKEVGALAILNQTLQTLGLAGKYASYALQRTPLGKGVAVAKKTVSQAEALKRSFDIGQAVGVADTQRDKEALQQLQGLSTDVLIAGDAKISKEMKNTYKEVKLLRDTIEYAQQTKETVNDVRTQSSNIDIYRARIERIENSIKSTEQLIYDQRTNSINMQYEAQQKYLKGETAQFSNDSVNGTILFGNSQSLRISAVEKAESVALMDDKQFVEFVSGNGYIDGSVSAGEYVSIAANRSDVSEINAGGGHMFLTSNTIDVQLVGVDNVNFADGTLTFDKDAGEETVSSGDPGRWVPAALRVDVTTDDSTRAFLPTAYSGPVAGIDWQYLGSGAARETISGTVQADFINGLSGDDIIRGSAGNDILDGGTGSNFLEGGEENDIFFTDARDAQIGWSTIVDFLPGIEQVTIWGFKPGVSRVFWEENYGADSFKGATAFIDMDGSSQTDRSGVDFAVTFSGHSVNELGPSYQLDGLMWFRPAVA